MPLNSPSDESGERVFVIPFLAAKPRPENAFIYGELASGGLYLESDPIGLAGGSFSTYSYGASNPVSNVDPLGLQTVPLPIPAPIIIPPVAVPGTPENQQFVDAELSAIEQIKAAAKKAAEAVHDACSNHDEECERKLDEDLTLCQAIAKPRYGARGFAICAKAANQRYAECLKGGGPQGIRSPLSGVETPL